MIFNNIFFKTQIIPDFGQDHAIVRIALCDNVGRTFYGEYLDSNDISKNTSRSPSANKPNVDSLLINKFGFINEIGPKHVKMLGTKDMVSAELKKWLEFYDSDVRLDWVGFYCYYDVCVLNDILWHGELPRLDDHGSPWCDEKLTYEYALKFDDPLKFVLDIRKDR